MIKLEKVTKSYSRLTVFRDLTVEFSEGKVTAIMGPSGCGKTTLLNILAGLVKFEQGKVVTTEDVSFLFQEPRLVPWLTVRKNVALVLMDKMPEDAIGLRVNKALDGAGLAGYGDYYPSQLSGGMRQRVAMARAFSSEASLLLMDEPFKSLDLKTRFLMMREFLACRQEQLRTVIAVTHDVKEAVLLGDRVLMFSDKPAGVLLDIPIDIPHQERWNDNRILQLEKFLLDRLLEL